MINLLVVEDNAEYCKNIINYISQYVSDVRVYGIAYTSEEAISIIDTEIPDIILLDLNLDDLGAFNILNYITENELEKYTNSILVFSNKPLTNSKFDNSKYINSYFKKPVELKSIAFQLGKLSKERAIINSEIFIRNKIVRELEFLNYNFSYHGSKYLIDALYVLYVNKDKFYDNLSRDVYPIVAEKYNKSANTVKCDISQATKMMICDCDEDIITSYFNLSNFVKPTVKQVIFTVLNKL